MKAPLSLALFVAAGPAFALDPPRDRPKAPPVVIERMVVDGVDVPVQHDVALPPGRRRLEFHYAAPGLSGPARFRYKLEGFDEDWVEAGGRRVAFYTNVPPGGYHFRVTAATGEGAWNEQGAGLHFRHRPRFTQTRLFYLLAAAGVLLVAIALHVGQVAGLYALRRKLERDNARKTVELERRNRELDAANSRLAAANAQLERLATEDGLTGLFNRRYLNDVLEKEWARAARDRAQIALVMLDIDYFKKLNDTYGHPTGDECLRKVAAVIREAIHRPADVAARYGGDEFAVLLPATLQAGAGVLGERIRKAVEALELVHRESPCGRVTVSCGVAGMRPDGTRQASELVERADQALYQAKQEGRNRLAEATPDPTPYAEEPAPPRVASTPAKT